MCFSLEQVTVFCALRPRPAFTDISDDDELYNITASSQLDELPKAKIHSPVPPDKVPYHSIAYEPVPIPKDETSLSK